MERIGLKRQKGRRKRTRETAKARGGGEEGGEGGILTLYFCMRGLTSRWSSGVSPWWPAKTGGRKGRKAGRKGDVKW